MAEKAKEENKEEEEKSQYEQLTSTQKCAILMLLIGEEEAANIMTNLNPDEVKSLGTAMYQVQDVDQDTVNMVLDEFLSIIKAKLKPKKSTISADMLDTANTYDDKVAVIRMIVGDEAGKVSNVFRQLMKKDV